jgi:hypothetical protein
MPVADARERVPSSPRLAPLAEARGVLRDALASLRNLEHLLRSPRVGPRALSQVIPDLRELCDPFEASVGEIMLHVGEKAGASGAARALAQHARLACARLRQALDQASSSMMGAKPRLAFEAQVEQAGTELNAVRRLTDLLSRAMEQAETELDIEEVVSESFSVSSKLDPMSPNMVTVVSSFPEGSYALYASPQVIVPLVALGIGVVQKGPGDRISVEGIRREGGPVVLTISHDPREGDVHVFSPPLLIAPTIACAEAAAHLAGGAFAVTGERVTITWRASS